MTQPASDGRSAGVDGPSDLSPLQPPAAPPLLVGARCPRCSAAVKPADAWCGLCFQDLRPPPTPPPARPGFGAKLPSVSLLSGPADDDLISVDPAISRPVRAAYACSACSSPVPVLDDVCSVCGFDRLSMLKSSAVVKLPVVGDVSRFSRNTLYVAAALGSVLVAGLVVLLISIVGALL